MNRHGAHIAILAILAAACLIGGTAFVMARSITEGNWTAYYSTLRSDPLGARVLYNALAAMPGLSVERSYAPLTSLSGGEGTTLFLLGIGGRTLIGPSDDAGTIKALQAFVNNGGRLVITFQAESSWMDELEDPESEMPEEPEEPLEKEKVERPKRLFSKEDGERADDECEGELDDEEAAMLALWDMRLRWGRIEKDEDGKTPPLKVMRRPLWKALPESLPWNSPYYVESDDEGWYPVYTREADLGQATILERKQLNGSVVVCSDSFYVSNEAMNGPRNTQLLSWLVGDARRVVFDETHLGLSESPGMMSLVRQYRFHGVVLALLAAGLLFLWRGASSLTPRQAEVEDGDDVASDSAAGLVNLLRRALPPGRLLAACLHEWRRSAGISGSVAPEVAREMETLCGPDSQRRRSDIVPAYRRICVVLSERGKKRG